MVEKFQPSHEEIQAQPANNTTNHVSMETRAGRNESLASTDFSLLLQDKKGNKEQWRMKVRNSEWLAFLQSSKNLCMPLTKSSSSDDRFPRSLFSSDDDDCSALSFL
jgi:hypothetical protein